MDEAEEFRLGELITEVVGPLTDEANYVRDRALALRASGDSVTTEEIEELVRQCVDLGTRGDAGAALLTASGVQDWVYAVKACTDLGYWANSAGNHAQAAATSTSPTEIHGLLTNAESDLGNAAVSINGA
jgi:hypothetical protein